VQHVDPGTSGCDQLISLPNSLAKNTSRGSYYWDIIRGQPEQQRFALYRYFKDEHLFRRQARGSDHGHSDESLKLGKVNNNLKILIALLMPNSSIGPPSLRIRV
jgi:hypothetical protein